MSDVMQEAMERLRNDPHEFRRQRDIAIAKIGRLMADPPSSSRIECTFELDASLALPYEINRAMLEMLLGDDSEAAGEQVVMYIFCQGLLAALKQFEELRDRLYKMGSLEPQADSLGMDLGMDERRVLSAESDVVPSPTLSMDEYFDKGYVGARCPKCKKRAVWHPTQHDLICLDGCGKVGDFEKRPGPNDAVDNAG